MMKDYNLVFSEKIKSLRKGRHMTQSEFSDFIGVKQQTLSGYERGIMKPSLDILIEIAEKCDVSIDWLCGIKKGNESTNIKTYADIVNLLFKIRMFSDFEPCIDDRTPSEEELKDWSKGSLLFCDHVLDDFVVEWSEALNVLYKTSINKDVTKKMYLSWKQGKLDEFSKIKLPDVHHID